MPLCWRKSMEKFWYQWRNVIISSQLQWSFKHFKHFQSRCQVKLWQIMSQLGPLDSLVLYNFCLKCVVKWAAVTAGEGHAVSRGKGSLESDATSWKNMLEVERLPLVIPRLFQPLGQPWLQVFCSIHQHLQLHLEHWPGMCSVTCQRWYRSRVPLF